MKHHFIDHYRNIKSPIQKIDPRIKLILSIFSVLAVVSTPNGRFVDYFLYAPFIAFIYILSRIPLSSLIKRTAFILPIIFIIAASLPFISPGKTIIEFDFIKLRVTDIGISNFFSVVIKAFLAITIMTILTNSTRFSDILIAMQKMKFPQLLISVFGFMYRYIFLFIDEAEKLNIGRRARSFGKRKVLIIKGIGWMVASLLIRSLERGERIYQAMCSRGFEGRFKSDVELTIKKVQLIYVFAFISLITLIKLFGRYYG